MTRQWDLEVDFLVAGSGAAGLSAAITTKRNGLDVFLVETEARWGGTTCLSGGGLWMPNNPLMHRDGVQDSFEEALAYMEATIGDVGPHTSLRGSSEGLVWTRAWRRFGDSGSVRIGKQYSFRDGANLPGAWEHDCAGRHIRIPWRASCFPCDGPTVARLHRFRIVRSQSQGFDFPHHPIAYRRYCYI